MRTVRKIGFLIEEISETTPAQQLLDRFLIGHPRDGALRLNLKHEVSAYLPVTNNASELDERIEDHNLLVAPTAEAAMEHAHAAVLVSRKPGATANDRFLEIALGSLPEGAPCFVHGALATTLEKATRAMRLAASRKILLLAGTPLGVTWRLPEVDLPPETPLSEALIVVQGTAPGAEFHALEALLPVIERRQGGESGIRSVRFLEGKKVWDSGRRGAWSWPLLAAALSRSHTPQGDPVLDGRTQDLAGLGLVPTLAKSPRAWLLEHLDGLRTTLLVLDGVVADFNFAVRAGDGAITSAQVFRAPPPGEQHYSRLTSVIDDFFQTARPPWPIERNVLIAGALETFWKPAARSGQTFLTPELALKYRASPTSGGK